MSDCDGRRTIKLFCPLVSTLVAFAVWEENKLDLGSIARAFGLDSSTVKLNGHFISRGVDLVSSSVTWRSLRSFFSSKGLSTGAGDNDALIVDGKLCKVGTKRAQDSQDISKNYHNSGTGDVSITKCVVLEDVELLKHKKLKEIGSGCGEREGKLSQWIGLGNKRKQLMEDVISLKKLKLQDAGSDCPEKKRDNSDFVANTPYKCCHLNGTMKRTREDEVMVVAPCKSMIKDEINIILKMNGHMI